MSLLATSAVSAQAWNPRPEDDDVVFDLPCEQGIAFRRVATAQGLAEDDTTVLADRLVRLGMPRETGGFMDYLRNDFIAGHFRNGDTRFFLMGKYEVTRAQYASLMSEACDESVNGDLPVNEISWYDAIEFSQRLTTYLRTEQSAPFADAVGSNGGYVRLPTETEWEFAARGGLAVSLSDLQNPRFPMSADLVNYAWIGGPTSSGGAVNFVGLLEANPLGLYDIYGNVAEMMQEPFRLNKVGRPHGLAGGLILKGGHFLGSADLAQSAWRAEQPLFSSEEPVPSAGEQFGMRLVIAGIALNNQADLAQVEDAWQAAGEPQLEVTTDVMPLISDLQGRISDLQVTNDLDTIAQAVRQGQSTGQERQQRLLGSLLLSSAQMTQEIQASYARVRNQQAIMNSEAAGTFSEADLESIALATSDLADGIQDTNYFNAETLVAIANEFDADQINRQATVVAGDLEQRGLPALAAAARRAASIAMLLANGQALSRQDILGLTYYEE